MDILLIAFALLGHLALWMAIANRLNSTGLPYRLLKSLEKVTLLSLLGVLVALAWWAGRSPDALEAPLETLFQNRFAAGYFWLCFGTSIVILARWSWRTIKGTSARLSSQKNTIIRVDQLLGHSPCVSARAKLLSKVPGNQILQLDVNEKTLSVPRLSRTLDGLTIAHLTDLHFTGELGRDFYEVVVDQINSMQADIVALTGDIMDETECMPWIGEVLGRLKVRHGVYCILGNHDRNMPDVPLIRSELTQAGLRDLGGKCQAISIRGQSILLAGNEMPWFQPAPDMSYYDEEDLSLKILLSHAPDQIAWARRNGFDLMMAGHTHGGQIRLPIVGPIAAQSRYGVRYSSGLFYEEPTLLHVSRGVSGTQPLRIRCRPELTKLVLRSEAALSANEPNTLALTREEPADAKNSEQREEQSSQEFSFQPNRHAG